MMLRLLALFSALPFLFACSQGLPIDKQTYAGYWQGEKRLLEIQINGSVMYIDKTDPMKPISKHGNIRKFDGDDFIIGFPPFETRFHVSKAPYQENGKWKMVVDDIIYQTYEEPAEGSKGFHL